MIINASPQQLSVIVRYHRHKLLNFYYYRETCKSLKELSEISKISLPKLCVMISRIRNTIPITITNINDYQNCVKEIREQLGNKNFIKTKSKKLRLKVPITINGITYQKRAQARKAINMSVYEFDQAYPLPRYMTDEEIKSMDEQRKKKLLEKKKLSNIIINGVEYSGITDACHQLLLNRKDLKKLLTKNENSNNE